MSLSWTAMFAGKNGQETTTVDIFLIGYAWFRNVHYGTRRSVHEATNFREKTVPVILT